MAYRKRSNQKTEVKITPYNGRAYGLRWRCGQHSGEITSGEIDHTAAAIAAGELLAELKLGILPKEETSNALIEWETFRDLYERDALPRLSKSTSVMWTTSANWLEKLVNPRSLADVNKQSMRLFRDKLLNGDKKRKPLSAASVRSYMAHIKASLAWACDEADLLETVPRIRLPRQEGGSKMRSRAITRKEFCQILLAAPKVRPRDSRDWTRFLKGLWHSGFRVDELRRLSWDQTEPFCVVSDGFKYPLIRILYQGQKARREEYAVIPRPLWRLIDTPNKTGNVFPLAGRNGQMSRKRVIRIIGGIGKASGVVTDQAKQKTATSHDIGKRAWLTRMDGELTAPELQKVARHASLETTMSYYHHKEAETLAAKLWEK